MELTKGTRKASKLMPAQPQKVLLGLLCLVPDRQPGSNNTGSSSRSAPGSSTPVGSSSSSSSRTRLLAVPQGAPSAAAQQLQSVALHVAIQASSGGSSLFGTYLLAPGRLATQYLPGMATDDAVETYNASAQAFGAHFARYR